jgi:TrmH family RNA methyltransferase
MSDTEFIFDLPMLSGPQNQRVKDYVELRMDGNVRREKKRFLLEGRKPVLAALQLSHVVVHELIFSDHLLGDDLELVQLAHKKHIELVRVSKDVFKKIADVMTPQGVAAVIKLPEWEPEEILGRKDALIVVACGLQDPGNVGTIIRSCEASGATGLVTLEHTADPYNAKVVRATAAGLLALPILRMKTPEFIHEASKRGVRLLATAANGGINYRQFDWQKRPLALCIGSEGEGLPDAIKNVCAKKITIPLKGSSESLNAAVAASILLFEASAR